MPGQRTAPLSLRNARKEELDTVAALLHEAYQQYESLLSPEMWREYLSDIVDVRGRWGRSELIVARHGGELAGAVTFYPDAARSGEGWPPRWSGVRLLGVKPAKRGLNIGGALMEECLRRSRARGAAAVGLHTISFMEVAKAMYERMGFVRAPQFDVNVAPGVEVIAYRLDLSQIQGGIERSADQR